MKGKGGQQRTHRRGPGEGKLEEKRFDVGQDMNTILVQESENVAEKNMDKRFITVSAETVLFLQPISRVSGVQKLSMGEERGQRCVCIPCVA